MKKQVKSVQSCKKLLVWCTGMLAVMRYFLNKSAEYVYESLTVIALLAKAVKEDSQFIAELATDKDSESIRSDQSFKSLLLNTINKC